MSKRVSVESTAEAYLELLAARGVEYFFANAGTDFAPLIEAYAKRLAEGHALPRPVTVPHEVPAVAMAHGYAMITGRPQAVMVHVIVGGANALGGIINAARANVPILMTAGRTPLTEGDLPGARDLPDPLGPGVVRPGHDVPRVGEVGLRAAQLRPARERGRPRPGRRRHGAAGPRLSRAAPRGAGGEAGDVRVRRVVPRRETGPADARPRLDRGGRALAGVGQPAARHRARGRTRPAGRPCPRRLRGGLRSAGGRPLPHLRELPPGPRPSRRLRRHRRSGVRRRHRRPRIGRAVVPQAEEPVARGAHHPRRRRSPLLALSDPQLPVRRRARRTAAPHPARSRGGGEAPGRPAGRRRAHGALDRGERPAPGRRRGRGAASPGPTRPST